MATDDLTLADMIYMLRRNDIGTDICDAYERFDVNKQRKVMNECTSKWLPELKARGGDVEGLLPDYVDSTIRPFFLTLEGQVRDTRSRRGSVPRR